MKIGSAFPLCRDAHSIVCEREGGIERDGFPESLHCSRIITRPEFALSRKVELERRKRFGSRGGGQHEVIARPLISPCNNFQSELIDKLEQLGSFPFHRAASYGRCVSAGREKTCGDTNSAADLGDIAKNEICGLKMARDVVSAFRVYRPGRTCPYVTEHRMRIDCAKIIRAIEVPAQ